MTQLVLQPWLAILSLKEQTVLLCALRGPDTGGTPEIKAWIRLIRRIVLINAAPRKTFMRNEDISGINRIANETPLALDMLPSHFLSHLMHAIQIIGYKHPELDIRYKFATAYNHLCEYLHVMPESVDRMSDRLADEI